MWLINELSQGRRSGQVVCMLAWETGFLILARLQATPPVTPEGMWCLFPSSVRRHRPCGRGLVGVLHCWGYAQASCLLLKLSALQSQTCLGLLWLRFLGNTALQSLLLECSAHSCLSFRLWYTLRTRKLLSASRGRRNSGPVDSLSALSFLLPLKALHQNEQSWTHART